MAAMQLVAGAAARTLAIPETQVLVEMEDGVFSQHILLVKLEPGVWVTVDADGTVERTDLRECEVSPLLSDSAFPDEDRPFEIFDRAQVSDALLADWRGRARQLASVLGYDPTAAAAGVGPDTAWFFADPALSTFGKEVPVALVADAARFVSKSNPQGAVALVLADVSGKDTWTSAQLVKRPDQPAWLDEKRSAAGRDPRLLPLQLGPKGRPLRFRDAEQHFDPATFRSDLFEFGAVSGDFCRELAATEAEPPAAAASFISSNGIGPSSGFAVDYTMVTWGLWAMACIDRLDVTRLACGEHLARWALRMQRAARRNPRSPDYEGLERYVRHALTPTGVARASAFEKAVAEDMKTEAFTMKQRRMEAEEREAADKRRKGKKVKGDGKGGDD